MPDKRVVEPAVEDTATAHCRAVFEDTSSGWVLDLCAASDVVGPPITVSSSRVSLSALCWRWCCREDL